MSNKALRPAALTETVGFVVIIVFSILGSWLMVWMMWYLEGEPLNLLTLGVAVVGLIVSTAGGLAVKDIIVDYRTQSAGDEPAA